MSDDPEQAAAPPGARGTDRHRDLLALAGLVTVCLAVAALGGAVTQTAVHGWYQGLVRPPFNPPDGIFAPVWTVLFLMMAVAAWRVWRRRVHPRRGAALRMFAVQLGLNLLWSCIFFGLQAVGVALLEIILLWASIAATIIRFARVDGIGAWLLAPYLGWVTFAVILNASIWWLNSPESTLKFR